MSIRILAGLACLIPLAACGQLFPDIYPERDVPPVGDLVPGLDVAGDAPLPYDPGVRDPGTDPGVDSGRVDSGCIRDCYAKVCGSDRCGGTCGTCPAATACSADQGRCILQSSQKPLGGACGQNATCEPFLRDPFSRQGTYANADWPACLNDQCREGDCIHGVCSRACRIGTDVVQNGTGAPFSDGIEDPGVAGECGDATDGPFGTEFTCVQRVGTEERGGQGVCLPQSSFAPCTASSQCPDGESCGYVRIRDNIEARCLRAPGEAATLGATCGFDARTGGTRLCDSWNCTTLGCTAACDGPDACITPGAVCQAGGRCRDTGKACVGDADCSAWTCSGQIALVEPAGYVVGCAPRDCQNDLECGDPAFYCLHRAVGVTLDTIRTSGRCAPRLPGGALGGEFCDVSPGDLVPDRPCANQAYCLDGRCGSMCARDDDCPVPGLQRCGRIDSPADVDGDGVSDIVLSVPVCLWLGPSAESCAAQPDCAQGTCTPWARGPVGDIDVGLACMTPPEGALPFGSLCGAGASGATCETRACLDERADVSVPGVCSQPCRDGADCPAASFVGTRSVRWVCESRAFSQSGTVVLRDDRYVSWCVPVPGASSLASCAGSAWCPDPDEVCRAVVRTGAPGGVDVIDYICIRPESGLPVGGTCNALGDGGDCATGLCVPTALYGVGYCSRVCGDDLDCAGIAGGAAICSPRVVVPRADPAEALAVPVCRPVGTCIHCKDDRDCDARSRCANLSPYSWMSDLRCVPACESDLDCPQESPTCTAIRGAVPSAGTETIRVCLQVACPG